MNRRVATAACLLLLLYPHFLLAQGTKLWLQSRFDEFEKGRQQNVGISSDGFLESAPDLKSLLLTPSTYIWAVAADRDGNAYLATGSPATVLRVSPQGKATRLFSTKDLSVQAVLAAPDGSVYAATLPSGKVYRIPPGQSDLDESSAQVVFEPTQVSQKPEEQPKYLWALALDARGALYIATGGPAAIYRVTAPAEKSKPELFFSSDEEHIRCLLFEPDGDLIAGSDGSGLVYRIGKDGKGVVLYDAPKREITAIAESPQGQLYVGSVGEKTRNGLPPLPVQGSSGGGTVTATITILAPGSVQASSSNSLISDGSEVDELSAQGAPHKLWATHDEILYGLAVTSQGLLAATGNKGRIYRIREDGTYVDLARAASGQATAFARSPDGTYIATSNTGRLYDLGDQPAAHGTYYSDVFDAGVFSTWGRVEVNDNEGGGNGSYELFARSGNIENPERNWGPWTPVTPNGSGAAIAPARFIQWKAVLSPGARIASVGVNYLPVNVAPVVDEMVVQPGARVNQQALQQQQPQPVNINLPSAQAGLTYTQDPSASPLAAFKDPTAVTVRWAAHDDNGDELIFDLYFRGEGEKNWFLLKAHVKDRFYTFDSDRLPDGGYRIKVVASDSPSHSAGDAMTGERESDHFVIDTTPPVIGPLSAKIEGGQVHVVFQATDAISPVARAEYSLDARSWHYLEPVGKLSDSLTEHYDFTIPLKASPVDHPGSDLSGSAQELVSDPGEHLIAVRVYDRYDNVSSAKAVVHQP